METFDQMHFFISYNNENVIKYFIKIKSSDINELISNIKLLCRKANSNYQSHNTLNIQYFKHRVDLRP